MGFSKWSHITPLVNQFHWLLISFWAQRPLKPEMAWKPNAWRSASSHTKPIDPLRSSHEAFIQVSSIREVHCVFRKEREPPKKRRTATWHYFWHWVNFLYLHRLFMLAVFSYLLNSFWLVGCFFVIVQVLSCCFNFLMACFNVILRFEGFSSLHQPEIYV